MKLGEKIAYYRRRAKLSQEELAARVGVSRQSVSKWELGESSPEAGKILPLARELGITADELLCEGEPRPETGRREEPRAEQDGLLYHLPGLVGRLARRYGWLAGVYVTLSGLGFCLVGGLAYAGFRRQLAPILAWQEVGILDGNLALGGMTTPLLFAKVVLGLGITTVAAGILLAVVLWRKGRK